MIMSATLIIAAHHLRRVLRNPGLILLMLAIPVTLAIIEYGAFGRTAAEGKLPPVKVLILDEDRSFLSAAVPQVFSSGPAKDFFELAQTPSREEAQRLFRRSQASALIVVPKGFQDSVLSGQRTDLIFYKNPIQSISPDIARSVLEMAEVIGNGLYGQAVEPIRKVKSFIDGQREPSVDDIAEISKGFYTAGRRLGSLEGLNNLKIAVQRPDQSETSTGFGSNPKQFFAYIFPGLAIFALLFISQGLALRLLRDRMRGLQRRILIAPVSSGAVLAGGIVYLVVGLFCLLLVLAAIGALVFRIELRDPLSLLAIGLGFAIFAAGLHLFSSSIAKSDRGAGFFGSVAIMIFSLIGGTFVPAEQYPPFMQQLAVLVPNGAAQQGFIDVLVHHRSIAELGLRLAVTWGWGLMMVGMAVFFDKRRMRV
jgi:ABC-2 type transport system permease protein